MLSNAASTSTSRAVTTPSGGTDQRRTEWPRTSASASASATRCRRRRARVAMATAAKASVGQRADPSTQQQSAHTNLYIQVRRRRRRNGDVREDTDHDVEHAPCSRWRDGYGERKARGITERRGDGARLEPAWVGLYTLSLAVNRPAPFALKCWTP